MHVDAGASSDDTPHRTPPVRLPAELWAHVSSFVVEAEGEELDVERPSSNATVSPLSEEENIADDVIVTFCF